MMKLQCQWNDGMRFSADADTHRIEMDAKAPFGGDVAPTPKQLLLAGICGCTGMDVVALLKKYKQPLESFRIEADAESTEGKHPVVFKEVKLVFRFVGAMDPVKVTEAVKLSQTRFCGVSAMVSGVVPISYAIELNGSEIGSGKADFTS